MAVAVGPRRLLQHRHATTAAATTAAVRRTHLQGLPAPVLAGREGGRRAGRPRSSTSRSPSRAPRRRATSSSRSRCCRPRSTSTRTPSASPRSTARPPARCMQQAKNDNIPVIAFDSGVDSDVPVSTASTDNLAAAAEAAKHMAELDRPRGQDRHRRARPDQRDRRAAPRRLRRLHEEERAEHQDRRHPVQRRPAQGDRPREGDHRGEPGPQGHLRLQRGRGDRRRPRGAGARHHGQAHGRRLRLRQGPDRRHQERPDGRRDHAEPGRHRLRDRQGGGGGHQGRDRCRRPSTPASTGTTRRTSTTPRSRRCSTSRPSVREVVAQGVAQPPDP